MKNTKAITVKHRVLSYESRECPKLVGEVYLEPGDIATLVNGKVPYITKNGYFAFVRFVKNGQDFRAGVSLDNIKKDKGEHNGLR